MKAPVVAFNQEEAPVAIVGAFSGIVKLRVISGNLRLSSRPTLWKVVPGSDSPRTCRTISGDSGARAEPLMQRECCCSALSHLHFQDTGLYFVTGRTLDCILSVLSQFYHMWETHMAEWLEHRNSPVHIEVKAQFQFPAYPTQTHFVLVKVRVDGSGFPSRRGCCWATIYISSFICEIYAEWLLTLDSSIFRWVVLGLHGTTLWGIIFGFGRIVSVSTFFAPKSTFVWQTSSVLSTPPTLNIELKSIEHWTELPQLNCSKNRRNILQSSPVVISSQNIYIGPVNYQINSMPMSILLPFICSILFF